MTYLNLNYGMLCGVPRLNYLMLFNRIIENYYYECDCVMHSQFYTQFEKGVIKSLWNLLDFQKNFGVEFFI